MRLAVVGAVMALYGAGCWSSRPPEPATTLALSRPVAAHRVGVSPGAGILELSSADLDRELDLIAGIGVRWLRLDFPWPSIEREPGNWNWAAWDHVVAEATNRRLSILGIVGYVPDWARQPATHGRPPFDPGTFARFATAVAQRYGAAGVRHWEIWNEPNLADTWSTAPDPAAYAATLTAAAAAIRDAVPEATVLSGGLAATETTADGTRVASARFLRGIYEAGGRDSFDAIAAHPYGEPGGPAWQELVSLRTIMEAAGDADKQVWLTEYGAPTGPHAPSVSVDRHADLVEMALAAAQEESWLGPLFWYSARDLAASSSDPSDNFGLARRDFSPKPAYVAFDAIVGTDPVEQPRHRRRSTGFAPRAVRAAELVPDRLGESRSKRRRSTQSTRSSPDPRPKGAQPVTPADRGVGRPQAWRSPSPTS